VKLVLLLAVRRASLLTGTERFLQYAANSCSGALSRSSGEGSSIAKRTLHTVAVDPVHVKSIERPDIAAEEEGECVVGAVVVAQPHLVEADLVADSGALAWLEYVAVRQDDGASVVEDVLNGVVVAAELDDWGSGRPPVLAGDLQAGVAAGVVVSAASAVIGSFSGGVKGVADIDAAAQRARANGSVIGGLGLSRVAMGGGDMDGEKEEQEYGEAW